MKSAAFLCNSLIYSAPNYNVPTSAPTNPYSVTVTSIADNGKQYSMSYTVSVLSAKIRVSGSINTVGLGTHLTQVQFVDQQTGVTYTGSLSENSYYITLDNQHTYNIVGYYRGLLGSSGTFNGGSLHVYAPVGYTTMSKDISG